MDTSGKMVFLKKLLDKLKKDGRKVGECARSCSAVHLLLLGVAGWP